MRQAVPTLPPPAPTRRGANRLILGAILGALPSGCALLPDPVPAVAAGPNRFREADSRAPVSWPDPNWWRRFGSTELERLMARMAGENLDLAVAAARVRQADASARIAGAALLPIVTGGGSAQRSEAGGGARAVTRYSASLAASYEIDFWGLNRNAALSARLSAEATRFDLGTTLITTEASVANTYFTILEARDALRIQEANLAAARRVLAVIRQQVAAGTATGLDLAQQETVVAQQEAAVPPLRQTVSQNIATLAVLVGRAPAEIEITGQGFGRLDVPSPSPGLPSELLARRPDVLAAEAALASANANVAVARAALLPSVTLSAQGGFQSLLLGTLLRPEAQFATLAASLAQTVFDGGALRGRVELARAQQEELLFTYRQAILSALSDVESALAALRETTEQEALLREAETRAARAYNIAEEQLRGGIINLITLLNTQATLFTARRNLSTGRLRRFQAAVGLFRALGGGWGPRAAAQVSEIRR
ncbi:efflux transporter outer membrane subunit [Muricoccus pecuniae]|uniref:NodT family efflux transporter outer membrane factor (OMF) lipoprotein n=1 Tax=Muricoccus pecuniae TaxID=693023 RepID=A0A840YHY2_9PROT|nr:efflux transporter outer membrane subunit [Roseomonas pecuniae]MBB5693494.1 NodT family efflux transporter outer membrane factor (OMF) lipoprotein [Roseomonas pecuniae]